MLARCYNSNHGAYATSAVLVLPSYRRHDRSRVRRRRRHGAADQSRHVSGFDPLLWCSFFFAVLLSRRHVPLGTRCIQAAQEPAKRATPFG